MAQEVSLRNWLRLLLTLGVLLMVVVMGLYFYKFAPGRWFVLSDNAEDWNHFGTFVGGIAGPAFGLMAFLGAVEAVLMQGRQLDVARQQSSADELDRMLVRLSDRIEVQLSRAIADPGTVSVRDFLDRVSRGARQARKVATTAIELSEQRKSMELRLKPVLGSIEPLLRHLDAMAWHIEHHEPNGSYVSVQKEYYIYLYADLVRALCELNLIPIKSRVLVVFADN